MTVTIKSTKGRKNKIPHARSAKVSRVISDLIFINSKPLVLKKIYVMVCQSIINELVHRITNNP